MLARVATSWRGSPSPGETRQQRARVAVRWRGSFAPGEGCYGTLRFKCAQKGIDVAVILIAERYQGRLELIFDGLLCFFLGCCRLLWLCLLPSVLPHGISENGGVLIFASDASNLVSADGNNLFDAFLVQP